IFLFALYKSPSLICSSSLALISLLLNLRWIMTLAGFKFAYERRRNFKISAWINLQLNFSGGSSKWSEGGISVEI
ncbi:hypothetical protein, partial [uncultured Campylobacter sp.]|uniref:hypothetical protein n=1 Tax=uncultured Campylobacter sp. TaxID=218934 RepID=UPI00260F3997